MPETIQIDEDLAQRLRSEANAQNLSLQAYAVTLLRDEVIRLAAATDWPARNERRYALVAKKFDRGLTPEEIAELQLLQAAADRRLEPLDELMLSHLRQMEKRVGGASNGHGD